VDEVRFRLLRKGDYIFGSFLKPESVDGYINGVNPGDKSDVLGRFPFSESSVDEAVEYANIGAKTWRRTSLNDRANSLRRFREHIARHQEKLAGLITRETGKPVWEARHEVIATVRALDLFLDDGMGYLAPRVIEEIGARSDPMPRGVVAVLTPYVFPLLVPATNTAAAMLAGNAVVFKASKFTPGVGQAIAEIWDRCTIPRGVFNMIQGPGSIVGERLVRHAQTDAVLFTGSFQTASTVRRSTFERPEISVAIHSGGKGISIVLENADLDQAVYETMVGAFLTTGQRHNSTGRVFVCDKIFDAFVQKLVKQTSLLGVGYGFKPDTFMGPLISENFRTRYGRYCKALLDKGHEALTPVGPERASKRRGFYAKPAIFQVHWENGAAFLNEEPPGPILLVYRVANWEEASSLHNQALYRLSTSVFTHPQNPYLPDIRDRIQTGALNLNRGTIGASLRLASVGLGRSSNGFSTGLDLLRAVTYSRAQLLEGRPLEPSAMLPGTNWDGQHVDQPTDEIDRDSSSDSTATLEVVGGHSGG
jgi:succinylglutamic semialdehyde dehydrogenase